MSDLVLSSSSSSSSSFDVEAQQSLLQEITPDEEDGIVNDGDDDEQETGRSTKSRKWLRLFLIIRSVQVFQSATSSGGYSAICSPEGEVEITLTQLQDSVIEEAVEFSAESVEAVEASVFECQQQLNIELQRLSQRENITRIVKKKNFQDFVSFGGVQGVVEALNTDLLTGLDSFTGTRQSNPKQVLILKIIIFHSFLGACKNPTVLILSVAAVLTLAFGMNEEGVDMGWLNGATVIFTIFVLITCTTIQDSFKEIKSKKRLMHFTENKTNVLVVRSGRHVFVPAYELQVGDIAFLRKGDQVPADGIFVPGDQSLEINEGTTKSTIIDVEKPFLFYGSKVMNGSSRMIVTSVGTDTLWGEMMRDAMDLFDDKCEFEFYLHKLNNCVHLIGLFISVLIVVVLFLRYSTGKLDDENGYRPDLKGKPSRVKIIAHAITGIVMGSRGTMTVLVTLLSVSLVGIMEGMPFIISLAIVIWNGKTFVPHKAYARDHLACIKMASVTTICTDKFGGLTEHEKEIGKLYIGEEFVSGSSIVASNVLEGLCDAIGTLCLAPPLDCESEVVPLVSWAEAKLGMRKESLSDRIKMINYNGCNPFQECCQMLIEKNGTAKYLHYKGPPLHVRRSCSHYYNMEGEIKPIDDQWMGFYESAIGFMQAEDAEVVAYAFKGINNSDEATSVDPNHLIFLGMISMINTKREETKRAISNLMEGGIRTVLVSGDHDIAVLENIGRNCGLLVDDSGDLVLNGEEFRDWTDEEKRVKVEKIRILGNCHPYDKILLIKCLREKGKMVALLAQQTLDAPALKQADIGVTVGTWSSEVAKENAHINLWDNDFNLLPDIIEKGRSFQANVRKFIQLQLITTIASLCINFLSIVFLGEAAMTVIQLFWLNLVIALFGGLALLLGPPTEILMETGPTKPSLNAIVTKAMWRNIVFQASYLTTVFVTLQQKGQALFGISSDRVKSMVYNGFFVCQIFNKFIARHPTESNIFRGVFHKNGWFFVATGFILICQGMFGFAEVVIGNSPLLNCKLWGYCLLIGFFCLMIDWVGKKITSNFIGDG